jgi:hypothetical protein
VLVFEISALFQMNLYMQASCDGSYGYHIHYYDVKLAMSIYYFKFPNGFIYHGQGCSLSFHVPPVFQGLIFWAFSTRIVFSRIPRINAIIRKKSNGIQLFEATQVVGHYSPLSWTRYVSSSEMAMEEHCAHEELELNVNLGSEDINVKQCGVQVIVDLDSFEGIEWNHGVDNQESEVERDRVIHVPPYHLLPHPSYHLLPHPLYGSIGFTTMELWKDYLSNFPFRTETLT